MRLPDAFFAEFALAVVISEDGKCARGAGINRAAAWVTTREVPHAEDPVGSEAVCARVRSIMEGGGDQEIVLVERAGFPDKEPGLVRMRLGSDGKPLPRSARQINEHSPAEARRAASSLLTFLAKHGGWPEAAMEIERGRARLGLLPLAPERMQ